MRFGNTSDFIFLNDLEKFEVLSEDVKTRFFTLY